jgi:hypothetical protein
MWNDRFEPAPPLDKAVMLVDLIDSIGGGLLDYGQRVADRWYQSNLDEGRQVPGDAVRADLHSANQAEFPSLDAYVDIANFATSEIGRIAFLDPEDHSLMIIAAERFSWVRELVFNPPDLVEDYRGELDGLTSELRHTLDELRLTLGRY